MAASVAIHDGHHNHHLSSVFRTDSSLSNSSFTSSHGGDYFLPQNSYMEKRQLFLRSYQFSRKKTLRERIKISLFRLKRLLCLRFRSARRLRRIVWTRLRSAIFRRRRRFSRLVNYHGLYGGSKIGSRWADAYFS